MVKKPLSIQLYTVRDVIAESNPVEVLQRIADIGYEGVEGFGYGYSPQEFRRIVEDMGMVVSSYFGPIPNPQNITQIVETSQALGVKQFVTSFWIADYETVDDIRRTADTIAPAVEALGSAGLEFCLHNHWFEYEKIDGKYKMQHLLEMVPGVKLEIDIYWAAAFGQNDPAEIVREYRSITPLLHVKDGPLVQGEPHQALGDGKMDIAACLEAADP
ncbi:MAG TPA: TIM barrel protein, partial [Fimbriimonadaceae bacterium]|nr:TIM barrel protein [Fimbriimonadaceae bacterium]